VSTATTSGTGRRSTPAGADQESARPRSRRGFLSRLTPSKRPSGSSPRGRRAPRRWPWIVALALVGVLISGAVYAVFFSSVLGVRSVSITGAPDPLAAKILAVVQIPDGTPLARIDLDGVATEIEAVPEVAAVEVARGWPGTLAITVSPRVPVAVTSANGQFWLLDSSGDPYLAVTSPPAGLLLVQLVAPGAGDPSTVAALTVAAALTPGFRAQVAEVSARTAFDVELTLTDGKKIIWGEATESAQKMQILPALLAQQQGTEYDVTDPTLVTVR